MTLIDQLEATDTEGNLAHFMQAPALHSRKMPVYRAEFPNRGARAETSWTYRNLELAKLSPPGKNPRRRMDTGPGAAGQRFTGPAGGGF